MHHVGVALNHVELLYFHRSELADLPDVVPSEIHQHVVLGEFLGVGEELLLQKEVLLLGLPAGTGTRQGEGVEDAVLQFHQGFGRGTGYLHVGTGEVEHVGRGVQAPEHPVGVEETAFEPCLQSVGEHDLEDISFSDVVLGFLHHIAELLLGVERFHGGIHPAEQPVLRFTVSDQFHDPQEFVFGRNVIVFGVVEGDVNDKQHLLGEVVEDHQSVEQHEVDVLESLSILGVEPEAGLGVLQVVVGEVSNESSGERRETGYLRAAVIVQDSTDIIGRVLSDVFLPVDGDLSVLHGYTESGSVAEEGVAAPSLGLVGTLQHEAVLIDVHQSPHHLDGGPEIR